MRHESRPEGEKKILAFKLARGDGVAHADGAGADHLGQHTLAMAEHALAQALADGIHLGARLARGADEQDRAADLELVSDKANQVDALGLDVRTGGAGRNAGQAQRGGVFGQLLPFDQADLPGRGLAGFAAEPPEVTRIAGEALGLDRLDRLDGTQRSAGLGEVQMQRYDPSVHLQPSMASAPIKGNPRGNVDATFSRDGIGA